MAGQVAISLSCPSCGATLRAPASAAGKRAKCPKCGAAVAIPLADVAPAPSPDELRARRERAETFRSAVLSAGGVQDLIGVLSRTEPLDVEPGLDSIEPPVYSLMEVGQVLEPAIALARILLKYEKYRSEWGLPAKLDHERCWQVLHRRLLPLIEANSYASVKRDAYQLAMELIQEDREHEALEYLVASRPGFIRDHEFWILACMQNLVRKGSAFADREAAIAHARAILSGRIAVTDECLPHVEDILRFLTQA